MSVNLTEALPTNDSYSGSLGELTKQEITTIQKLRTKSENIKKEYDQLRVELEAAIKTLRTSARVSANLPEAIPFLPKSDGKMEIMIDLSSLRSKLKTVK